VRILDLFFLSQLGNRPLEAFVSALEKGAVVHSLPHRVIEDAVHARPLGLGPGRMVQGLGFSVRV